jgi:ABC-type transporter lipoprotein component MlaA
VDLALKDANQEKWIYVRTGTSIIHTRAELAPAIDATKEQSLDYYASVRSAYLQSRSGAIAE